MRGWLVIISILILTGGTAIAQDRKDPKDPSKGQPGTYKVGQLVNAHTLMVCQSKVDAVAVADAFKIDDAAGEAKWQDREAAKTVLGEAACGRVDGKNKFKIAELPVEQAVVGAPNDREKMTVIKMDTTSGDRSVWALIFGDFDFVDGTAKSDKSSTATPSDAAKRIAALKTKGGSDAWDIEVKAVLLAAYDKDRSGEIDTENEIRAIACEVWRTMDTNIRKGDPDSGLAWTYGFKSRIEKGKERYDWIGDAFGINERLRKTAFDRLKTCGLDLGV